MELKLSYVALAASRITSTILDIVLVVYLFTLVESYNQGNGQSICAASVGLVTNVYDIVSLFDPTGFVSETPMVAVGDALADIVGIASVIPMAIQGYPPADAPWAGDWWKAFGLLIVFLIFHASLGIARSGMWWLDERRRKADKAVAQDNFDDRSISLAEIRVYPSEEEARATEHAGTIGLARTTEEARS